MLKIQSFDWSHFKFNFQIQIFKFKTTFCVCPFLLQNVFLKLINNFVFIVFILADAFSSSIKTGKSQKNLFTLAENNFGERNFLLKLWRNFICGNETGSPGRAVSLHLACSGSQSEHRIRCILPARGTCHIIRVIINPVVGKPCALIGSFSVRILQYGPFPWKRSNLCIFVLKQSRQIQNLQPRQRKKSVKIVILHIETTSRS